MLNVIDFYLEMRDGMKPATYFPKGARLNIQHAKKQKDLISFDVAWLYLAEMVNKGTLKLYKENLYTFNQSLPMVDPLKKIEYFQAKTPEIKRTVLAKNDLYELQKSPFETDSQDNLLHSILTESLN